MRILLDENTPRGVRRILGSHDARTALEMGWAGVSNGQLLDGAEKAGFDALVTCDQSIIFQQNLVGRNIAVVVLSTNTWPIIRAPAAERAARRRQRLPGGLLCRPIRPPAQIPADKRSEVLKQRRRFLTISLEAA